MLLCMSGWVLVYSNMIGYFKVYTKLFIYSIT